MLDPGDPLFHGDPRVLKAGTLAAGLYTKIVSYCRAHRTGGEVSLDALETLTAADARAFERLGVRLEGVSPDRLASSLRDADLLTESVSPGVSWRVAGWVDEASKLEVSREKRRQRNLRYRSKPAAAEASPEASQPSSQPSSQDRLTPPSHEGAEVSPALPPFPPSQTLPLFPPSSLKTTNTQAPADTHAHAGGDEAAPANDAQANPGPAGGGAGEASADADVEAPEAGSPEARRQRYAKAFGAGITDITGKPFVLGHHERCGLAELLNAYKPTDPATGKLLRLKALDDWLRGKARAFAKAYADDDPRYTGSLGVAAFGRFLRAPDPSPASAGGPPLARAPARPPRREDIRQRGWTDDDDQFRKDFERQLEGALRRLPEAERATFEARRRQMFDAELDARRARRGAA